MLKTKNFLTSNLLLNLGLSIKLRVKKFCSNINEYRHIKGSAYARNFYLVRNKSVPKKHYIIRIINYS